MNNTENEETIQKLGRLFTLEQREGGFAATSDKSIFTTINEQIDIVEVAKIYLFEVCPELKDTVKIIDRKSVLRFESDSLQKLMEFLRIFSKACLTWMMFEKMIKTQENPMNELDEIMLLGNNELLNLVEQSDNNEMAIRCELIDLLGEDSKEAVELEMKAGVIELDDGTSNIFSFFAAQDLYCWRNCEDTLVMSRSRVRAIQDTSFVHITLALREQIRMECEQLGFVRRCDASVYATNRMVELQKVINLLFADEAPKTIKAVKDIIGFSRWNIIIGLYNFGLELSILKNKATRSNDYEANLLE